MAMSRCSVESNNSAINFWRVILAPTDLDYDNIFRETFYRQLSLTQCGSLALQNLADNISLFCQTPDGQCLLSNASYPAYYDDSSGGGGYRCYTTSPPLVDGDNARAVCSGSILCCPPPFQVVGGGAGCIYADWSLRNFDQARSACRAFWPSADLYQGPGSIEIGVHLLGKLVFDPWVGARRNASAGGQWGWVGGGQVTTFSWSNLLTYQQPDNIGYHFMLPIPFTLANGTTTDCAIMRTAIDPHKLADNYCEEHHHYICQIPQ